MTEQRTQSDTNGQATLVVHMHAWKHDILKRYYPDRQFVFTPFHLSTRQLSRAYAAYLVPDRDVFIWSLTLPGDTLDLLRQSGVKLHIFEDGFLRSNRAFAGRTMPLSLTVDSLTAHFDAHRPSSLERLLDSYPFEQDVDLLNRARTGLATLLAHGVTKYNGSPRKSAEALYGKKHKPRILVLGQVDGDASLRFGCSPAISQTDLVHAAVAENPDCEVIFRPHPDVINRVRPSKVNLKKLARICRIVTEAASITDAFDTIDRVYTLTSLGGFEALMRGLPVTVFGYPFYAGWGLTDDRSDITRRSRRLTVEQLFAGAYLLYPIYFDPITGKKTDFEETIRLLQNPDLSLTPEETGPVVVATSWLHKTAVRMIEPLVSKIGSKEDGTYFKEHPFDFFQERPGRLMRLLGRFLFEPS